MEHFTTIEIVFIQHRSSRAGMSIFNTFSDFEKSLKKTKKLFHMTYRRNVYRLYYGHRVREARERNRSPDNEAEGHRRTNQKGNHYEEECWIRSQAH